MATNHNQDEKNELEAVQKEIAAARQSTSDRFEKVDDLTSRFRELRRKNHFRLMLEELFNE
jgi:hypothetical protein